MGPRQPGHTVAAQVLIRCPLGQAFLGGVRGEGPGCGALRPTSVPPRKQPLSAFLHSFGHRNTAEGPPRTAPDLRVLLPPLLREGSFPSVRTITEQKFVFPGREKRYSVPFATATFDA